ncbi:protein FAM174C [Coturnix japonica]|nr:protein FAM174C [Coturnix japonica]
MWGCINTVHTVRTERFIRIRMVSRFGTSERRNPGTQRLSSACARPRFARTFLRRDHRWVPAMLRPQPLYVLLLLLHGGRAGSPNNGTETPREAEGNGTRTGGGLLPASGLPVLRRAVFVVSALSVLAALYFVLRTFRSRPDGRRREPSAAFRWKKPQRKKYGLLSSSDDRVEMASLDSEEDTVFETQNLRR